VHALPLRKNLVHIYPAELREISASWLLNLPKPAPVDGN
jgi:hypothetical protein